MKVKISVLLIALCLLLCGCAPATTPQQPKTCNVVLSQSEAYNCEDPAKKVVRGSDVNFTLHVHNGYAFRDISYPDCEIKLVEGTGGESTVELTLHNVRYSAFVEVSFNEVKKSVTVVLQPSEYFRCEGSEVTVAEGDNAVFTLFFPKERTFDSVNYAGSFRVDGVDGAADENGERRVTLTLENVVKNITIEVKAREAFGEEILLQPKEGFAVIGYALNGGRFTDERGGRYYAKNYTLPHGIHPNVSQGQEMAREGYLLTGWNTKSDGTGEHVGLGSRASVEDGETLLLYAEWAEETAETLFDYVLIDRNRIPELYSERRDKAAKLKELTQNAQSQNLCAVITKFHGNAKTLVIPDRIGEYEVCVTAPLTLSDNRTLEKIVFPNTMRYLMERSFLSCSALKEIVLSDNMRYVDYNAFGVNHKIETLRINAATPPLNGLNESAQLANKLELLSRSGEGPRTVFFGSCATWYGVNAEYFTQKTGRNSYNMAVEGDTCILFQLDLLAQYLRSGDTLVYNCDLGSPYLMLYDISFDQRAFRMVEFNYDLLATLNIQRYDDVLSALNEYLITKRLMLSAGESGSYSDYIDYVTERGDMGKLREGPVDDMVMYHPREIGEIKDGRAFEKTENMICRFLDMGLDVHYGFGPICMESVTNAGLNNIATVSALFDEEFVSMSAPLIFSLADVVWQREDFYDQPYRLDTEASYRYTDIYVDYFLNL